nr:Mpo1-like protein [Mycobacterium eburneum]
MPVPAPDAAFSEKMAYYRTQHRSRGVRITHMIGTPVIVAGMPLLAVKPRAGAPMFVGGWLLQIAGHRLFEHNLPSTHKGWITYQLTGLIHVCEQYGQLLARRSRRKSARKGAATVLP